MQVLLCPGSVSAYISKVILHTAFWHEIIYKSLIPTFGKPTEVNQN